MFVCTIAVFDLLEPDQPSKEFKKGPVKEHIGETSSLYRVLTNANKGCPTSPEAALGYSDWFDLLGNQHLYFRFKQADDHIVIHDPESRRLIYISG